MRLNKYEKEWIKRLTSGKSLKHKNKLFGPRKNSNCCLGVAVRVCEVQVDPNIFQVNLDDFPDVTDKIRIHPNGRINQDKVTKKWKKYFDSKNIDYDCLMYLNDETNMTHKQIGEFINENREAVFIMA